VHLYKLFFSARRYIALTAIVKPLTGNLKMAWLGMNKFVLCVLLPLLCSSVSSRHTEITPGNSKFPQKFFVGVNF